MLTLKKKKKTGLVFYYPAFQKCIVHLIFQLVAPLKIPKDVLWKNCLGGKKINKLNWTLVLKFQPLHGQCKLPFSFIYSLNKLSFSFMFKASPFGTMADTVVRSGKVVHYHPLLTAPPISEVGAKYSLASRNVDVTVYHDM